MQTVPNEESCFGETMNLGINELEGSLALMTGYLPISGKV